MGNRKTTFSTQQLDLGEEGHATYELEERLLLQSKEAKRLGSDDLCLRHWSTTFVILGRSNVRTRMEITHQLFTERLAGVNNVHGKKLCKGRANYKMFSDFKVFYLIPCMNNFQRWLKKTLYVWPFIEAVR